MILPEVRVAAEDTLVLADGFSCRSQIEQATGRRGLHLAEALALALRHGPGGPPDDRPEQAWRSTEPRADRLLAAISLGAMTAVCGALTCARIARQRRS